MLKTLTLGLRFVMLKSSVCHDSRWFWESFWHAVIPIEICVYALALSRFIELICKLGSTEAICLETILFATFG